MTAEQKKRLLDTIFESVDRPNNQYSYNYYFNNCLTLIRDQLDIAFNGQLSAQRSQANPESLRSIIDQEIIPLWGRLLIDYGQGNQVDQIYSEWDSTFLPERISPLLKSTNIPQTDQPIVYQIDSIEPIQPRKSNYPWIERFLVPIISLSLYYFFRGRLPRKLSTVLWELTAGIAALIFGILSGLLWLSNLLEYHPLSFYNSNVFLGTPFLLLHFPLSALCYLTPSPKYRKRFHTYRNILWSAHTVLALAGVPLCAFLIALWQGGEIQNFLLPWLFFTPVFWILSPPPLPRLGKPRFLGKPGFSR